MRRSALFAIVLAVAMALAPSVSLAATASSGLVWRAQVWVNTYGSTVACLVSEVTTNGTSPVSNRGEIRVYDAIDNNCSGSRNLPTGWIGVTIDGYRNGSFCGTTYYQYSSSTTWIKQTGAVNLCTNPAGSQNFHTNTFGRVYNGSGSYHNIPGISSPGQNG